MYLRCTHGLGRLQDTVQFRLMLAHYVYVGQQALSYH